MKNIIKYYLLSTLALLTFSLISALILTIFNINNIFSQSTLNIIGIVISYLITIIISYIIGLKLKRHGLIHGLSLSILFLVLNIIFGNTLSSLSNIIKIVTQTLFIIFFMVLGVNTSK